MKRTCLPVLAATLVVGLATAQIQQFDTIYDSGNGQDGNMFDVTAKKKVNIVGFDVHYDAGSINLEIYTTPGGIAGKEFDPLQWTLVAQYQVTGQGDVSTGGNPTPLPQDLDIEIPAGTTMGFYITNSGGSEPSANYTNGGGWSKENDELLVVEGTGNSYPFGSPTYTPRIWNGTIYYKAGGLDGIPDQLSLTTGGSQVLSMDVGAAFASKTYVVAGSLSGTLPGIPFGAWTIPLNFDPYLLYTVNNPNTPLLNGNFGVLNSVGQATAVLTIPPASDPALAGLVANHAGIVLDFTGSLAILEVTDPVPLTFLP